MNSRIEIDEMEKERWRSGFPSLIIQHVLGGCKNSDEWINKKIIRFKGNHTTVLYCCSMAKIEAGTKKRQIIMMHSSAT